MRLHYIPLLSCISLFLSAPWSYGDPGKLHRGPYLQQASPNSVVIVWRTQGEITPVVRYGTEPGALTREVAGDAISLRVSHDVDAAEEVPRLYKEPAEDAAKRDPDDHDPSTAPDTYQYEASILELPSDAKFYYAVFDGDRKLAGADNDHFFVTHPPVGSKTDMRIWVVGDSGTGGEDQALVHEAMRAFTAQDGRPIDHYIHVGDMAYGDGTDWEFQHHFFAPYQATLRNTVCWPTMGNHEGHTSRGISGFGPYYDAYVVPVAGEVGGAASGTEAYYSFDISEVHFICLDSHDLDRSPDAAMAQWLRADLEQTKAKWLIAFWHHPPYTKGSHDSDVEGQLIEMRENFMPILESGGVDLTLTGHSHIYERSMLMDGAYATPTVAEGVILDDGDGNPDGDGAYRKSEGLNPNEGSVSLVAGHGGTSVGRKGTMPVMREIIVEHGSVLLDIQGDTLTGTMLNKHGETRDLFSIVKKGEVTPERVENPWQPKDDLSLITRLTFNFIDDTPGEAPEHWAIAGGNKNGMAVAGKEGSKRRHLRAEADDEPLIGIFEAATIKKFEYESYIRLPEESDSAAALIFGYTDKENYWRVLLDARSESIKIFRIADGTETLLAEKDADVTHDKWLKIEAEVVDEGVEIQYEEKITFTFDPGAQLPDAHLGFYVPAGGNAEYLVFQIER